MEPYSPTFRRALKQAHPDLQDADIDRLEELTTRRAHLLPEVDAQAIDSIDLQIQELLRDKMPYFERIAREEAALRHAEKAAVREPPQVVIKPR